MSFEWMAEAAEQIAKRDLKTLQEVVKMGVNDIFEEGPHPQHTHAGTFNLPAWSPEQIAEQLKEFSKIRENMMQTIPNSGILLDDRLDGLRGRAIIAATAGLPLDVVVYIQALEHTFLQTKFREHENSLKEVAFKVK